jgi:thymidylate synthase
MFDEVGESRDRSGDRRVRVAVMHHQLLPVSAREERKAFEALVNLGQVRRTFAEYGFDLVLHGHKHESSLYWDLPSTQSEDLSAPLRRMLVIASPGHFGPGTPTMRAVFLDGNPGARNLRVRTFLGAGAEHKLRYTQDTNVPLWIGAMDAETADRTTIRAGTAHLAYARIRAYFELRGQEQTRNLVCRVDDPSDAGLLPPEYPELDFDDPQRWFSDLVEWWQRDRSELVARGLVSFNHGERVRTRWGNQVSRAARQLNSRDDSSRALIALIHPSETGRYEKDGRDAAEGGTYPAFALAEFSIRRVSNRRYLDCFAYFRKQEMQYWWPVNVAEIASLQQSVLADVRGSPRTGRIVTFSAIALWKDALPRVAVTEADRLIEQPDRLWALAAGLAFPPTANDDVRSDWRTLLADLAGASRQQPPRPMAGIGALRAELARFAALPDCQPLDAVMDALDALLSQYEAFEDRDALNPAAVKVVSERCEAVRVAVGAMLGDR